MPIGARSSWSGVPGLVHRCGVFRRGDRERLHGQRSEQRRGGRLQRQHHLVVGGLGNGCQRRLDEGGEHLVVAAADLVPAAGLVEHALEGEHDVVGVEVARRLERGVRLEFDTMAQLERVAQAVGRDRPSDSAKPGRRREPPVSHLDQPIARLFRDVEAGVGGAERRVQRVGTRLGAYHERVGASGKGGEPQQGCDDGEQACHGCPPDPRSVQEVTRGVNGTRDFASGYAADLPHQMFHCEVQMLQESVR